METYDQTRRCDSLLTLSPVQRSVEVAPRRLSRVRNTQPDSTCAYTHTHTPHTHIYCTQTHLLHTHTHTYRISFGSCTVWGRGREGGRDRGKDGERKNDRV